MEVGIKLLELLQVSPPPSSQPATEANTIIDIIISTNFFIKTISIFISE
jgi:hypothetical protein